MVVHIRGSEENRRWLEVAVSSLFPRQFSFDHSTWVGVTVFRSDPNELRFQSNVAFYFIKGFCAGAGLTCEEQD